MQDYTNILTSFKLLNTDIMQFLIIIFVKLTAISCQISDTSYTYIFCFLYIESGQHNITYSIENTSFSKNRKSIYYQLKFT